MPRPKNTANVVDNEPKLQQPLPIQSQPAAVIAHHQHAYPHAHAHPQQQHQHQLAAQGPPPPQQQQQQVSNGVDLQAFLRVRDSTYASLNALSEALGNFTADYIRQTNMLLGDAGQFQPIGAQPHVIGLDQAFNQQQFFAPPIHHQQQQPPVQEATLPVVESEKRKKRAKDAFAPKRPLTPFFLYMNTARPIIANDLGDGVPKGAVQKEGERRWGFMPAEERRGWDQAYQYNLRLYKARVHSYKSGNTEARKMTDAEASEYAETQQIEANIGTAGPADTTDEHADAAIAEQLGQTSAVEEEPPAPPAPTFEEPTDKTPKPKKSRKRKETATEEETPAAAPTASAPAAAPAAEATPAPKRKRASKAADKVVETPVVEAKEEQPKKKGRKSKGAA